jgi:hypothetical protein
MQAELQPKRRSTVFNKAWFMWLFLIFFPPIGLIVMWRQGRFSKKVRWIITMVAAAYFVFPIYIGATATVPLYYSHDEFVTAYEDELKDQNLSYELKNEKQEEETITSKLTDDITLVENMDSDQVHELVLIGQGDGMDIILSMGQLIGTVQPELKDNEIGDVLEELQVFDKSFKFENNETTVTKNDIRFNLKYSQASGVIFTVSKVSE